VHLGGGYARRIIALLAFWTAAGDIIDATHGPTVRPLGVPRTGEASEPPAIRLDRHAGAPPSRLNAGRAVRSLPP